MKKTLANKLVAMMLIGAGIVSNLVLNDATFLLFTIVIGGPLFFAQRNWII